MNISATYSNTLIMPKRRASILIVLLTVLLTGLCLFAGPVMAGIQKYQAPLHTVSWETSSKKNYCSLNHTIPFYGKATFSQSAGDQLGFEMKVKRKATRKKDLAQLQIMPPGWKHQVSAMDLGEVSVHKGDTPFQLNEDAHQCNQQSIDRC